MVGMRPLEKSLEKLDDVRKKKLSEMIGGPSGDPSTLPNSGLESYFVIYSAIESVLFMF